MKKTILIVILVVAVLMAGGYWYKTKDYTSAESAYKSAWIGTTFYPLPQGVVSNSGGTVGDARYATYAFDDVTTPNGRELWLSSMKRDAGGNLTFTVTDALPFVYSIKDTTLLWDLCGLDDPSSPNAGVAVDNSIVTLVNGEKLSTFGQASAEKAWKANTTTGKFESLSPVGISCLAELSEG